MSLSREQYSLSSRLFKNTSNVEVCSGAIFRCKGGCSNVSSASCPAFICHLQTPLSRTCPVKPNMNSNLQRLLSPIHRLRQITQKYGPAYILVSQILSWTNFLFIYVYLRASGIDVSSLTKQYNVGPQIEVVVEKGGTFALAMVLNRVLSPLRLVICLGILPWLAPMLNPVLRVWWERVRRWWAGFGRGTKSKGHDV